MTSHDVEQSMDCSSDDLPEDVAVGCSSDDLPEDMAVDYSSDELPEDTGSNGGLPSDIGSDGGAGGDAAIPGVPGLLDATFIQDDIMELYSAPRVVPAATAAGLRGSLSIDIQQGHDLMDPFWREWVVQQILSRRPRILISSAPCTAFCAFIHWNKKKMSVGKLRARQEEGLCLLNLSLQIAGIQHAAGRGFLHEHPSTASSWKLSTVMAMIASGSYATTDFDQCCYGLKSPLGYPMKKRTRLLANSVVKGVRDVFDKKCACPKALDFGKGLMRHKPIMGSEGGYQLSRYAQHYPPAMVDALVEVVQMTCQG